MKSKKAISAIVEYVLLVTFALVTGVIVYSFMKTYVPQEELNCPDGSSLQISEYNYDCATNMLSIKFTNSGRFSLGGYFIYTTNKPNQELATIDLTKNNTDINSRLSPNGIKFGLIGVDNSLEPNQEETDTYNLTGISQAYSIQIVPIRWQEKKNTQILVSCKNEKIKKTIECA